MKSAVFVVADFKAEAVVFVLVFFEEHVFLIAQVFFDLDILDIWNIVAGFLGVGFFEADDFGAGILDFVFFFLLVLVIDLAGRSQTGLAGQRLEKRARIGLARIGRDDGVLVEVVELFTRIGIGPLGTAFGTGHLHASSNGKCGARKAARAHIGQSGYGQRRYVSNAKCWPLLQVAARFIALGQDYVAKGAFMIIAVDGPAASGKGTLAAGLARHYRLPHLDTGLLYRAVGLAVADAKDNADMEALAIAAARGLDAAHLTNLDALTSAETGVLASKVAVIAEVRAALFDFQRNFALQPGGAVLDGRDIGTKICPDADVKLFIQADSKARMERRARQLEQRGNAVDRYALFHQIEERDARDMLNPHGGFYKAEDAHLLDTTLLDIETALRAAIEIVDRVMALKAGG